MLKIVNLCITNKDKNKFLFCNRVKPPYIGYWGMLGGKIDKDEDPGVAASRELMEESGIEAKGEFLGKCHEKIFEDGEIVFEFDIYFYHFVVDEDIKFNDSVDVGGEIRWFDIDKFEKHQLIPSDPLMINSFLKKGKRMLKSFVNKIKEGYFQDRFEEVNPGVGVGVMILRDGKVLLGRRYEEYTDVFNQGGTWTMPGGKLEYGESFEEGAKREIFEETGLKLNNLKIICINNNKNEHVHFVIIGMLCDDFNGEPEVMEPNKISEWRWFNLNELPEKLYFPSKKILNNHLKRAFYIENE